MLAEAPLYFGSKRCTADITWCLVVREESDYFYGPNNVWMVVCVPVLWLCWDMTDIMLRECASCLNMRSPLSHLTSDFYFEATNPSINQIGLKNSSPPQIWQLIQTNRMNNINVLYFKMLFLLTVIGCLNFLVDGGSVFTAEQLDVLFIFQISSECVFQPS